MGFDNIGMGELVVLLVLGLFVFGPERLPKAAADAGRALRGLRRQLKGMTEDLRTELGPEMQNVDLASLHPRTFVQKHLLSDDEDELDPVPAGAGRVRPRGGVPLAAGEPAPWDPDTT